MRAHTAELCLDAYQYCWCGFVEESDDFLFGKSPELFLHVKLCISDAVWQADVSKIMKTHFDFFDENNEDVSLNFKIHEELQLNKTLAKVNSGLGNMSNGTVAILTRYKGTKLYQHDASACPDMYEWCWCGLVNSVDEYHGELIQGNLTEIPQLVIDCRLARERPFLKY